MRAFLFNQKMSFPLCCFFLVSSFLNTFVSPTQHLCNPDQKDALIEFKTEFEIQQPTWNYSSEEVSSYPKTESWVNKSDCCSWDGITCDAKSGEVVGLNLSASCLHGQLKSDSSLFRLRHLRDLNLAYNNFTAFPIPAEFDKLMRLERLNLSESSFSGQIPNKLLQLTKLVSLDLSSSYDLSTYSRISLSIDESFLHLLALNLRNLRDLDMSYLNISSEIPHEFSTMWSLRSLRFDECNLFGEFPSNVLLIPNLQSIRLDYNQNLRGNLPVFHRNNSMQILSLFFTSFSGTIPDSISNLKHLTSLSLSHSNFSGRIPSSIGNLSHLSNLDLAGNNFIGEIPFSIGHLKQLTRFAVSINKLSGNFPSALLNLTQLRSIFLHYNHLTGFLPPNISQLSKLEVFSASHNSFVGAIPSSLFTISSLTDIFLDNNKLNDLAGIENITLLQRDLEFLDLSNNKIKGPLFIPSRSIQYYLASENNFTGEIPQSTCGLSSLVALDLSNNNLHGSIPRCLETSMSYLSDLNLRNNNLNGSLPDIFINAKELITLDVSHNRLEGKLPASLIGCSALEVLNVGSNEINDVFPFQLNSLQKLQVLVLHSNKFHGSLHKADGVWVGFPELKIIDASHNDFLGSLPYDYFVNWTAISVKRDNYTEPDYIRGNSYASIVLMSKGVSMEMERILTIYTAIDFSGNKLHGEIPDSIGLLKELHILNLSSNAFSGHIPASLANLTNLESLDLSQNKISGEIPPALGTLSSLSWINISHNQLVGPIPQGTQFQRQNCSSYEGNPGIYGPSLKDVCGDNHVSTPEQSQLSESSEEEDEEWFSWIAAGLGLVPGVVLGLTIGYKYEWFTKTFGRSKH